MLRLIRRAGPHRARGAPLRFEGTDLLALSEGADARRPWRADRDGLPEAPGTALNPVLPVGRQIARLFELHQGASRAVGWARTIEMLKLVGISDPDRRARQYAHQLSGGMCVSA